MDTPISVLVVEDHALFRTGIKVSCNKDESITVTGEASNGSDAIAQVLMLQPDVLLMDVSMPLMDGIESTRQIKDKSKKTKVIMLTSHENEEVLQSALSAGASGYCLKDVESDILCSAIRAVHRGEMWLDSLYSVDRDCMRSARERFNNLIERHGSSDDEISSSQLPVEDSSIDTNQVPGQENTLKISSAPGASVSSTENKSSSARFSNNDNLFDRYENLGVIGQGGMSHVYKARHKMLDKVVAVKVLAGHLNRIDAFCARFVQEARVASSLSHTNIASVFDFGVTPESNAFLVMEYVKGPSLAEVLRQDVRLDEARAIELFKQLIDALSYAHKMGVVHRDIKPANVILTNFDSGHPHLKLVDFGLAKVSTLEDPKLTINGEVMGSPLYMSPEQCQGLPVDNRSDIYSLGCLMHEVICGQPPFRGETALDTFRMHVQVDYQEPSENECSDRLRTILRKCLSKNPNNRYSNLDEIKSLL